MIGLERYTSAQEIVVASGELKTATKILRYNLSSIEDCNGHFYSEGT